MLTRRFFILIMHGVILWRFYRWHSTLLLPTTNTILGLYSTYLETHQYTMMIPARDDHSQYCSLMIDITGNDSFTLNLQKACCYIWFCYHAYPTIFFQTETLPTPNTFRAHTISEHFDPAAVSQLASMSVYTFCHREISLHFHHWHHHALGPGT